MSNKIFYTKTVSNNGRVTYTPVAEYDSDLLDSFPKGNHLVMSYPGGVSRRFNIKPDHAAMIAAGRFAEDAMSKAMMKQSELKPTIVPLTAEQRESWNKLAAAFGKDLCTLQGSSTRDIIQAGIDAMINEVESLLSNPAVRRQYEQFMLLCQLTKENENAIS